MTRYLRLEPAAAAPVEIAPTALIDESAGEVRIGQGTKICHGAVIQGPAVIGANCLIGNYAFIRPGTVLSNDVRVGFSTEIKNAVVEKHVDQKSNDYAQSLREMSELVEFVNKRGTAS